MKIMKKESNFLNIFGFTFTLVGLILMIAGYAINKYAINYDNVVDTTGVITRIETRHDSVDDDTEHDVYVAYEVEGEKYESRLGGYMSSFREGKEIEIYYNQDDPEKIGMKDLDKMWILFPIIGSVFLAIGVISIVLKVTRSKFEKRVKSTGEAITVQYVQTTVNHNIEVNGRYPYIILCDGIDPYDGQKRVYESRNIYFDPEPIIRERGITTFTVYIDKNNRNKYVVDLDVLK